MGIVGGCTEGQCPGHEVEPVDKADHHHHHLRIAECYQEITPGLFTEGFGHPAMDSQSRDKTGMGNSIRKVL
jgi:hypothetical protein